MKFEINKQDVEKVAEQYGLKIVAEMTLEEMRKTYPSYVELTEITFDVLGMELPDQPFPITDHVLQIMQKIEDARSTEELRNAYYDAQIPMVNKAVDDICDHYDASEEEREEFLQGMKQLIDEITDRVIGRFIEC